MISRGEYDSCSTFEDVEIIQQVRILEEQAVHWMCAEIDCATASDQTYGKIKAATLSSPFAAKQTRL